jgi:hypothetical protein
MVQTKNGDKDAQSLQHHANENLTHNAAPRRWPIILAAVVLLLAAVGGVTVILWASNAIDDLGVALNFIAQNTLSLFVLLAIVVQSFIYWDQRNLMRKQWKAMMDGVERTDDVIEQMRVQLKEIRVQRRTMQTQAVAALSEARSTREGLIETRRLVAQNERAVIAAEQSANVARESFHTGDRAYVFLDRVYLDAPISTGKYPVVHLEFRNTGKTPALNCRIVVRMAFLSGEAREMAEKGVMPTSTGKPTIGATVIGASGVNRIEMPDIGWKSPEFKARSMSGEYTLYVWGEALYSDIFEREHFSTFCVFPESTNSKLFSFSPHGNDCDRTESKDGEANPN